MIELTFEEAINRANAGSDTFWVCDYRFDTIEHKPIRAVPPTLARMCEYNINKYRSSATFSIISNRTGRETTKRIRYWDNVAYGHHLHLFTLEEEAWEFFKSQTDIIFKQIEEYRQRTLDRLVGIETTLHNLLKETCINLD